ncbi:MAG: thioredoxin family protein [Pseudomonadota bacterium]
MTSRSCTRPFTAPEFCLPATSGRNLEFENVAGPKGTVIAFICNHCPHVVAAIDRIVEDVKTLRGMGIGFAAICSNDSWAYPADSFEQMQIMVKERCLPFAYMRDRDSKVARAYGATRTPEFLGFDQARVLQYRGRLDDAGRRLAAPDRRRELVDAMALVLRTGRGPDVQNPTDGGVIKWADGLFSAQ